MNRYTKMLRDGYKEEIEFHPEWSGDKYEYLGSFIFDFTTYDGKVDSLYAHRMVSVLKAILGRRNFEYIKNPKTYDMYLTMVNMPFLINKLDWGTSIRGAWLDDYKEYKLPYGDIIPKGELTQFVKELIQWVEE